MRAPLGGCPVIRRTVPRASGAPEALPGATPESVGSGVGALDRVSALFDVLGRGSASPSEIAAATGIPRGTVARLIRAMTGHGFVARLEDGRITLGPRIAQLAAAAGGVPLADSGAERLAALRDATGASTVRLFRRCGPTGTVRVCIAEVLDLHAPHQLQLGVPIPLRVDPVTQTFLAWQRPTDRPSRPSRGTIPYTADTLAWTRRRGWAQGFSGQGHCVATVAAPVLDQRRRRLVGVLAISGPVAALTKTPGRVHGRTLIEAASASEVISECLYRSGESGQPVSSLHLLTSTRRGNA
ncbi:helix-turn-helix domain-containing protein [Streptomyces sp. NPDC059679]|uniref:helix-turn-helix domain-containing protein n=1 Tax=Streptomyces sp. NPDC059679 TaxID=3346903 RepID=UPI0036BA2735